MHLVRYHLGTMAFGASHRRSPPQLAENQRRHEGSARTLNHCPLEIATAPLTS